MLVAVILDESLTDLCGKAAWLTIVGCWFWLFRGKGGPIAALLSRRCLGNWSSIWVLIEIRNGTKRVSL